MKNIQYSAPLKKTIIYMHRMINSGKWKSNYKIPTITNISKKVKVSNNTVKKAICILEQEKYLDNNGTLGYYVVPPNLTTLYTTNKQLYLLHLLKLNTSVLEMINKGAKTIGKYVYFKDAENIELLNVISGDKINTSVQELKNSLESPIKLSDLIPLRGIALELERTNYFRQQKLRDAARIILRSKEI